MSLIFQQSYHMKNHVRRNLTNEAADDVGSAKKELEVPKWKKFFHFSVFRRPRGVRAQQVRTPSFLGRENSEAKRMKNERDSRMRKSAATDGLPVRGTQTGTDGTDLVFFLAASVKSVAPACFASLHHSNTPTLRYEYEKTQ